MFDIRAALGALVARMIDGRAPATPLKSAVLAHYGVVDEAGFAEAWYRQRIPRELVHTAQTVAFTAWLEGDAEATRLVERAAEDYACTAGALVRRTGDPSCVVAFGGGVIDHAPDEFLALLAELVHREFPEAPVIRPVLAPGEGAALLAAFHAGRDPAPLYARLLAEASPKG